MDENLSSTRYEPAPIDLTNKNSSQAIAIELIGENKQILEIGTATGYVSKILKDRGNIVTGIEIDPEAASIAGQYCNRMIIGDIEQLNLDELLPPALFDVIVCGDVLEHLKKPETILKKLRKFLKPDGYIVVSLPNFFHADIQINLLKGDFHYTPSGLLDETHLRFFGLKNIYSLFSECGYQIRDLKTTILPAGTTELKTDTSKMPPALLRFFQSLPDATVYQYVFTAHPSEKPTKDVIEETDIESIFQYSLKEYREDIRSLLNSKIKEQGKRIESLEQENRLLQQKIESVEGSTIWQLTMKFHMKVIERLLPPRTRRRKYYDLGIAGGRLLIHDGFNAFYWSVSRHFHKNITLNDYQRWIDQNETTHEGLNQLKSALANFWYHPKISIITPVWNTDEKWLRLAIESVMTQVYDDWELCLVDGGSTKPHIKHILQEYSWKDKRIKIKFLTENKGIAENSNEALSLATGEFVGFLDHDDELAPFALYEIVKLLNQNSDINFIYSDEDKIDQKNLRKDPFFKPDWSPDLFLSQNYLCHFSVIRKTLIDSVGGFHAGYDGSQDYDLFLRCTEKISPITIVHVPKILYHWRMIQGSAAEQTEAKPYAITSAKKALSDALARRGLSATVTDGLYPSSYRVCYTLGKNPKVAIIIPTKNKVEILQRCVQSILDKTGYQNYEIIIVDNQSSDDATFRYYSSLESNSKITLLHYDKPFNFSAINNYAVANVDCPFILFLNNDTEVISSEWLSAMLEHAQREDVGAVGAKLLYPNNQIQHAGVILGITGTPGQKGVAGHSHKGLPGNNAGYFFRAQIIGNYSTVTAACLMMRKDVFQEIGGFDEAIAIAFNDVDLCLKIRQRGYMVVYTPYAQLYHHESLSRGYENTPEKQARFSKEVTLCRERWGKVIDSGDPYYNPNLTLCSENFLINYNE